MTPRLVPRYTHSLTANELEYVTDADAQKLEKVVDEGAECRDNLRCEREGKRAGKGACSVCWACSCAIAFDAALAALEAK